MTKLISAEKKQADEEKKIKDERERLNVQTYKNNAKRLKEIPYEIERLKSDKALTKEHIDIQIDKAKLHKEKIKLQVKDLGIRENNFKIQEPKYDWELDPEWILVQKDLLNADINELEAEMKALEFNIKCNNQSLLQSESNFDMQIRQVEDQEKRCFESHKEILKQLVDEHKWKPEQLSELKKECNYKCCR